MGLLDRITKKKQQTNLLAYLDGEVLSIEAVGDGVFSEKMLGDGVAILPESEVVRAPADGEISIVMDNSYHAVGLKLPNGMECLIHIGLDTVAMNGDGFTAHVTPGEQVKTGDKLISFSREAISAAGYKDITMLVITNSDKYPTTQFSAGLRATAAETVIAVV